jgi:ParB family chromosome partitioning protein
MSTFKRRAVSPERVAAAEAIAATVPIVGDPRIGTVSTLPVTNLANFASMQNASNARYEVGSVNDVPITQIKSNPLNPRAVYTSTSVDEMAVSLASNGQRISATGFVDESGTVVLIEGETRLRGARAAGLISLRVEIRQKPETERALYEQARAANVERRDQTPLDDAIRWKELLGKGIYPTQGALAKALELSDTQVSRTLALSSLTNRLVHAIADQPDLLNFQMLNALREFFDDQGEESTLELVAEVAKTGMGYRDVVNRRNAAIKGPVKRPRAFREPVTFKGAKGELKTFEGSGRMELILKGLSPEAQDEIAEKIKSLFPKE